MPIGRNSLMKALPYPVGSFLLSNKFECFKKYAVNEVLRKIAFCDRTWDSIFESLVIAPVTVLFMLYGIELVIVFFRML